MTQTPRIVYRARDDATSESEVAALRNIYRFIIDCHAKKEATRPGGPGDAERDLSDSARDIIRDTK